MRDQALYNGQVQSKLLYILFHGIWMIVVKVVDLLPQLQHHRCGVGSCPEQSN